MGKYKGGEKRVLFNRQNCGFNTSAAVLNSTSHCCCSGWDEERKVDLNDVKAVISFHLFELCKSM